MSENVVATEPLHVRIAGLATHLEGEYPPHVIEDVLMASKQIEAFDALFQAVCGETGFANAVRVDSGLQYPWPALDAAEALSISSLSENSKTSE